MKASN